MDLLALAGGDGFLALQRGVVRVSYQLSWECELKTWSERTADERAENPTASLGRGK